MLSVDTLCWFFLVAVCCCGEANDFLLQGCSLSYSNRKKMVDTSPADVVFLEPTDDLREDPFILPDVLGYLRMLDPVYTLGSNHRSESPPWHSKTRQDIGC